ncbi:MAG: ATP-binding cassette domain-containing protein [Lewinellaceae bacterium]|nr:ATP-binding cassette domain-containing protein [Lewinellaceae bacterium]
MELVELLRKDLKENVVPLAVFTLITGIANAALISFINTGAEYVTNNKVNHRVALLFLISLLIYILGKRYVAMRSAVLVEAILNKIRYRLADKIRHAELATLEARGTSPFYARLGQDTVKVSNFTASVITAIQAVILIVFTTLYISTISIKAFVLVTIMLSVCFLVYSSRRKIFRTMWLKLSEYETRFYEKLGHILDGFKEIKINRSKNESVLQDFALVNEEMKDYKTGLVQAYIRLSIFSQAFFFILLGSVIFVFPQFHEEYATNIVKITAAILFISGPFEIVLNGNQQLANANSSARNILELEAELEEVLRQNEMTIEAQNHPEAFEELPFSDNIRFHNLSFAYPPVKGRDYIFEVGPIDLTIKKGELIFITGGNGSGKSTFLKLMTGLYQPKAGQILVDVDEAGRPDTTVSSANYQQYRNLFTTIFTDFHLFDKLYGIRETDPADINAVLKNMELPADKTTYRNGGFTNLRLSTGQKKRLALTTCIIEDKPIYIFDEVAADLDPEFRDKYYYQIIRELRARNKTVIVVSHDRYYWTVPDRLLEMANGKMRELTRAEIDSLLKLNKPAGD